MNKLKKAIAGATIYLTQAEIAGENFEDGPLFNSTAELAAWCTTFGLQYETVMVSPAEPQYKIFTTS